MLSLILTTFISLAPAKEFKQNDYCNLTEMITHESVAKAITCLKTKKKLFVFSNGGLMDAGDILLKYVNKHKVTVLCVKCYSMAAFLWINAENKEFGEGGQLMFHYGYIIAQEGTPMTIDDLRKTADDLEKSTEAYFDNSPKEHKEFFIRKMKQEGNYFFGQEVLDSLQIKYTLINKPKAA
jgi:ATP-dependent protease ClpP protease subunit